MSRQRTRNDRDGALPEGGQRGSRLIRNPANGLLVLLAAALPLGAQTTATPAAPTPGGQTTSATQANNVTAPVATAPLASTFSANAGSAAQLVLNPSSLQNPYYGSVTVGTATAETLKLSLEDAVERGVQANLAIANASVAEQQASAERLQSLNALLPTIKAEGMSGAHEYNLEAFGFGPRAIAGFARLIPNFNPADFSTIVKVNVTQADAALNWALFDYAALTRYRSAQESAKAAFYSARSSRGLVVLNVGNQYLKTLADQSQIESAQSLARADEVLLQQAQAEHEAGTVPRLDELRARVQYQTQQQKVIAAQNTYDKDLILLKREIGVPVEQKIELTDTAPYTELERLSLEEARRAAYQNRQDYQGLQWQLRAAQLSRSAARYERLPTINASGNFGVTGVTGDSYHGTFMALGELRLPLFKEAQFRGDRDVAEAQKNDALNRLEDLKQQIDQQLRDSMLDLNSSSELVRVSQQNVELATRALSDANDRFAAGVEDNLPVVQAQATLSQAQSQLISDTLQYNQAKLGLARNLGIVDTQYKSYLRGK